MRTRFDYKSLFSAVLLICLTASLPLYTTISLASVLAQTLSNHNRKDEVDRLNKLGIQQYRQGQFKEALETLQRILSIYREIKDRQGEGTVLNNLGQVYYKLGNYQKALEYYSQALPLFRQIGDRAGEATILNNLGQVYYSLRDYQKALEYYSQVLPLFRAIGDKAGEGTTLNNIGAVYIHLGKYDRAQEYYAKALAIFQKIGHKIGEANTLNNLGEINRQLSQYPKALEFFYQALAIFKENRNSLGRGTSLHNIGLIYDQLRQYLKAVEYYQKALVVRRKIDDRAGEATTLNNLGLVKNQQRQYSEALQCLKQALSIFKELGYPVSEANTLDSLGTAYKDLGQYSQALEYYRQALGISREVGNRNLESITLSHIGNLLAEQNQLKLAIVFFKQSINIYETIRQYLRVLPKEEQQSYTETVAKTYRRLADLLLKQNRILEAQRVLDLLKVQELDDYLKNIRGNQQTSSGIELLPQEEHVAAELEAIQGKEIELGKELTQLRKLCKTQCTPAQEQRIVEIEKLQQQVRQKFNQFIKSDDVKALVRQLNETTDEQNLRLTNLNTLRNNLQPNTVLLYPLILEDRLELVLVSLDSPPLRRTVVVKREDLNRAIIEFRRTLQNPGSDAKTPAHELYKWLIKPIESDLKQAQAKTIIYAPDAALRYIPLAALYDGQQWLVQRFAIHNITAASLDDLATKRQTDLYALAGAFTQGRYSFQIGSQHFDFSGLSFAGKEVENLAAIVKNTTKLIDQAFSPDATIPRMGNYNLVHLATHAAFIVGKPEESFILFGNGDRVTLRDVENWNLTNVDLIVLSACETAIGDKFGNGEEILGFGYLMQQAGAKAAIASLWTISDGGTQALMDAFYAALQDSNISKSQALSKAQVALITGDFSVLGKQRGAIIPKPVEKRINSLSLRVKNHLNHPYYWAPFVLIGNGL